MLATLMEKRVTVFWMVIKVCESISQHAKDEDFLENSLYPEKVPFLQNHAMYIDTLQWAIHLPGQPDEFQSTEFAIKNLTYQLNLTLEQKLSPLRDWYLVSHPLHSVIKHSIQDAHNHILNKTKPSNLKFTSGKFNTLRTHHNDKQTISFDSFIQRVKNEHILRLESHHGLLESELRDVFESTHHKLHTHPSVAKFIPQRVKFRHKRFLQSNMRLHNSYLFNDPSYPEQWHLHNERETGMDINVTQVWRAGYNGSGITVCVVDDGLEWNNPDLRDNYRADGSWDMIDDGPDPSPDPSKAENHHGTRCAGEIAAVANNSICGVGVAFGAGVSGIRMLDGPMTDAMEATAFTKRMRINDIYSCSWGPEDDGKTVDGPDFLAEEGLRHGVDFGRQGYGSLYVMASGNGGLQDDNCNFDGYANSIYTITIGAVDEGGAMPYYAEECASMLAVTYSSGDAFSRQIVTTDWTAEGATGCTSQHTGTSAAAPLAAGMLALAMQANPCLTWRDYKYLIILTAVKVDKYIAHYTPNAAGLLHSHKHGFGLMDAWRLVNAARVWKQVPWLTTYSTPDLHDNAPIPGRGDPLVLKREVTSEELDGYSLGLLEEVQVTITLTHQIRGALLISLTCPSQTHSLLAEPRELDTSGEGFKEWSFTTVRCWGETPEGTYQLTVTDTGNPQRSRGVLVSWRLKLHGVPMTSQQWQERQQQVLDSYSGALLDSAHVPECESAPETLEYNAPISERVLKMICTSAAFCFVMALYETMEYMCCYDDEKKEQAKELEEVLQKYRQRKPGNRRTDYTQLAQADDVTMPNINDDVINPGANEYYEMQELHPSQYEPIGGHGDESSVLIGSSDDRNSDTIGLTDFEDGAIDDSDSSPLLKIDQVSVAKEDTSKDVIKKKARDRENALAGIENSGAFINESDIGNEVLDTDIKYLEYESLVNK